MRIIVGLAVFVATFGLLVSASGQDEAAAAERLKWIMYAPFMQMPDVQVRVFVPEGDKYKDTPFYGKQSRVDEVFHAELLRVAPGLKVRTGAEVTARDKVSPLPDTSLMRWDALMREFIVIVGGERGGASGSFLLSIELKRGVQLPVSTELNPKESIWLTVGTVWSKTLPYFLGNGSDELEVLRGAVREMLGEFGDKWVIANSSDAPKRPK